MRLVQPLKRVVPTSTLLTVKDSCRFGMNQVTARTHCPASTWQILNRSGSATARNTDAARLTGSPAVECAVPRFMQFHSPCQEHSGVTGSSLVSCGHFPAF